MIKWIQYNGQKEKGQTKTIDLNPLHRKSKE